MNLESLTIKNLAENVPGMIYRFYVNSKGVMSFDYVSSKAYEMYEVRPEDFQKNSKLFLEMCHPDEASHLFKLIEESRAQMTSFEWEGRIITRSGQVRWVWAKSIPVRWEDGSTYWDGVLMDTTEKRLREIELQKINQQLKEAQEKFQTNQVKLLESARLASLGEMAGGVAHEINNPLTVIVISSEKLKRLISEDGDWESKKDKLLSAVEKIEGTANRISKIVSGLKCISRNGSQDPLERVLIGKVIEDALSLCLEKARNTNIMVEVDRTHFDLIINCRPVQISQVLLNLLNNAMQAIELKSDKRWIHIEVEVDKNKDKLNINICDSGMGIPQELREKIFSPFFTTKDVGQGTGLGLSISRGIIENHGGSLTLDASRPFTCFKVQFPYN